MHGRLFANLAAFGRVLRSAGMQIGPSRMATALSAVDLAGIRHRADFYWALHATLVSRPEQIAAFDAAFDLFWGRRDPDSVELEVDRWKEDRSPDGDRPDSCDVPPNVLHLANGLEGDEGDEDGAVRESASALETLRDKHFDRMTADELSAAKRAIERLEPSMPRYPTRRRRRSASGNLPDWRRSLAAVARNGSLSHMKFTAPRDERPTLVLLCDVSGSMQAYSRVLLHFVCALSARLDKTHAFLMGTRLTDVTRLIESARLGDAVDRICAETRDFDAGTRIGDALLEFNKWHARKLLSRRAIVVLVTDGLEGTSPDVLDRELARLARSCGHLAWLNPLLRFEGFEPLADGVRIMARHAHSMRAIHSLRCVEDIARTLGYELKREPRRERLTARAG